MQHETSKRTRRRRGAQVLVAVFSLILSSQHCSTATAFFVSSTNKRSACHHRHQILTTRATRESLKTTPSSSSSSNNSTAMTSTTTTSSSSWSSRSSSSRFGVRKRVKAVLKKAASRTGRSNFSDGVGGNVVADAASIGGVGDSADFVFSPSLGSGKSINVTDTLIPLLDSTLVNDNNGIVSSKNGKVDVNTLLKSGQQHETQVDHDKVEVEPLPFKLPQLTKEQETLLAQGERIQEQSKMGREGSGYVVLDVKAPPYVVWECLLDFESYPERIGTVRSMRMFTNTHLSSSYLAEKPVLGGTNQETRHYGQASISRASFILSKFRLNIAAVHQYQPHPDGHYMVFTLDRACKNVVLQDAKGIWYTESLSDDVTRVWLLCELKVSPLLPTMIVDYAAKRAMPRATTWLKPAVEEMKRELHRDV